MPASAVNPPVRRALLSVTDKSGLVDFARALAAAGVELYSTGGTRKHLEEAGLAVHDIAAYTGFPEMMDGRLKTLHPRIFGGILGRHDRPDDLAAMADHGIRSFEVVVVNLYAFEATAARPGATLADVKEQIDIGGPSLIRAAAKNFSFVAVATDPAQYPELAAEIAATGRTSLEHRRQLAAAAFERTARYDRAIADYFARETSAATAAAATVTTPGEGPPLFPPTLALDLELATSLRYGENPHQAAALYRPRQNSAPAWKQLHGKELSYNNLLDLDSAWTIARSLAAPAVVVIKHNNPCGAAEAGTLAAAAVAAWNGDPVSAFGSVLGVNAELDEATARVLVEPGRFIEAIVAPGFSPAAVEVLTTIPKWKANVRLVQVDPAHSPPLRQVLRQIDQGWLAQEADLGPDVEAEWKVVTQKQPTPLEWADLRFAWRMVRHVKSNAIVVAAQGALAGVGAGQMSRVDSTEIALAKAAAKARGAVLASDAFFPFPDSIVKAAEAGIAAVIQPGGSVRDQESIAACDERGVAMIFTGRRHFKH